MIEFACTTSACVRRGIRYPVENTCLRCLQRLQQISGRKRGGTALQSAPQDAKHLKPGAAHSPAWGEIAHSSANLSVAFGQLVEAVTLPERGRQEGLELEEQHWFIFMAFILYKKNQRALKGKYLHASLFDEDEFLDLIEQLANNEAPAALKSRDFQCVIRNSGGHFYVCSIKYEQGKWHFLLIDPRDVSITKNGFIPCIIDYIRKTLPIAVVYIVYTNLKTSAYQQDYLCYFHSLEMAFRLSGLNFAPLLNGYADAESEVLYGGWLREIDAIQEKHYPTLNLKLFEHNIKFISLKSCPAGLNRVFSNVQSSQTYDALSPEFKSTPASQSKIEHQSFATRLNRRHATGLVYLRYYFNQHAASIPKERYPDINEDPYFHDRDDIECLLNLKARPEAAMQYPNASAFPHNYTTTYFALKYIHGVKTWLSKGENYQRVADFYETSRVNLRTI
jgi:hypothetical protein